MLKTNQDKIVVQSITGKVHNPTVKKTVQRNTFEGNVVTWPSVGAICYNVTLGDSVYGWVGDHVEPDVSVINNDGMENGALNFLSCVGNTVKVMTGEAKGKTGIVTGKHGGVEHVIVWFDKETKELLCPDDKILVKAVGQGLALTDYPSVRVMNTSPELLQKLPITPNGEKLKVGVKAIVPACLMGAGQGMGDPATGDYDIMTQDRRKIKECGLDDLCLGDLVYLKDCDNTLGRGYVEGSGTLGVVIHCDCVLVGHGPGVTSLMSARSDVFEPYIDKNANIGKLLGIID